MNCPACKTVSLSMSERNGIEIDFCPECRGVWLDRGELDKIIEKSAVSTNNATNHNMQQQSGNPNLFGKPNDYYKYKRKKSFLEEIFD
jgi:Zn-finger nucleic acid-binding protein